MNKDRRGAVRKKAIVNKHYQRRATTLSERIKLQSQDQVIGEKKEKEDRSKKMNL